MAHHRSETATDSLADLQARFSAWRSSEQKGGRIPEDLWHSAAMLARQMGVNPVASALHLDFARLKRRVTQGEGTQQSTPILAADAFVELAMDPRIPAPVCTFEYQGRHGKLTIHLSGHTQTQTIALADRLVGAAR